MSYIQCTHWIRSETHDNQRNQVIFSDAFHVNMWNRNLVQPNKRKCDWVINIKNVLYMIIKALPAKNTLYSHILLITLVQHVVVLETNKLYGKCPSMSVMTHWHCVKIENILVVMHQRMQWSNLWSFATIWSKKCSMPVSTVCKNAAIIIQIVNKFAVCY